MEHAITRDESRGSALLWFGVLAGPLAWITQLIATYSLEEWFACAPATTDEGNILGLGVKPVALGISIVLGLVTLAAGLVAWRCLQAMPASGDASGRRARWMAIAGVMNSILYGIAIAVSLGPPLLLDVCEVVP